MTSREKLNLLKKLYFELGDKATRFQYFLLLDIRNLRSILKHVPQKQRIVFFTKIFDDVYSRNTYLFVNKETHNRKTLFFEDSQILLKYFDDSKNLTLTRKESLRSNIDFNNKVIFGREEYNISSDYCYDDFLVRKSLKDLYFMFVAPDYVVGDFHINEMSNNLSVVQQENKNLKILMETIC